MNKKKTKNNLLILFKKLSATVSALILIWKQLQNKWFDIFLKSLC